MTTRVKKKYAWLGTATAILVFIWTIARLTGFNVFDVAKVSEMKEDIKTTKTDISQIQKDIGDIRGDIRVQGESIVWLKNWAMKQDRRNNKITKNE